MKFATLINARSLPESTDPDFDFDYVDISRVTQGVIDSEPQAVTFRSAPSRARRLADPGDTVVSTVRTYLRAVAEVSPTDMPQVFSTGFAVIKGRPGILDPRFLTYYLQSSPFVERVVADSVGVSYPAINASDLAAYDFWAPNMIEQTAIADFLDRETAQIDAMIEANEKMISALHERLISEVTARILPQKGTSTSHKWFGNVAWEAPKLWRHAKITNGSTPKRERTDYWGGDFPWLNSSVVNLDSVAHADQFVTETALAECHLPIVPAGSVLVGLTGQGRTRGKATELHMTSTINQHMAAVIPDPAFWVSRYLTLSLRSAYEELRRISDANGATKGALTCEALAAFRVPLPPLAEQRRLAVEADTASSKTRNLVESAMRVSVLLRERREALITAAVSGRIDPTTGIERIEEAS